MVPRETQTKISGHTTKQGMMLKFGITGEMVLLILSGIRILILQNFRTGALSFTVIQPPIQRGINYCGNVPFRSTGTVLLSAPKPSMATIWQLILFGHGQT